MDKSIHFAITEFNNCFIIRSPSLFLMTIFFKRSDLPFSRKSDRKKEKSVASCTHKQNIICSQTLLVDECAWADHHLQAVICRSSGGLSASEKKIAPDDAKRIIFFRLETSEAHRTRVRRKLADEERALYKLKETAEFLDRCSVGKKEKKKIMTHSTYSAKALPDCISWFQGTVSGHQTILFCHLPCHKRIKVDGLINKNNH